MHSQAGVHGHSNRKKIFQDWNVSSNQNRLQSSIEVQKKRKNRQSKRAQQYLIRSLLLVENIQQILMRKNQLIRESQTSKAQLAKTYKRLENYHVGKNMQGFTRLSQRPESLSKFPHSNLQKMGQSVDFDYEIYYQQIRRKKKYLKKMEVFSLSNLINYDSKQVQIQFVHQQQQKDKEEFKKQKMKTQEMQSQSSLVKHEMQSKKSILKKKNSIESGQQSPRNAKITTFNEIMPSRGEQIEMQEQNHGQSILNIQSGNPKNKSMKNSENKLREVIQNIKKKRNRMQQTLVMYQYNLTESKIVPFQTNMEFSLAQLSQCLSQQNMINIHYLMIHQLKIYNEQLEAYRKILQTASKNLKKFQAIDDSILLMKSHTQQMKEMSVDFQQYLEQLNKQNPQKIVLQLREKIQFLDSNIDIYKSNKQNFARYSPQTNIEMFQTSRRQYINELNKYQAIYNKLRARYLKAQKNYQKKAIDDPIFFIKNEIIQMKRLERELENYRERLNKEGPNNVNTEFIERMKSHHRIIDNYKVYKQSFTKYNPQNYVGITEAKRQYANQLNKYQSLYKQLTTKYRL